ncbi:hypothetical protein Syun_001042 [Stephania yunnanensis]|uniref:Uncharacterized protein n=1 Tax=Stephania yunnanensis TaxID=152371 RepID=A0AAP0LES2_9MAGN
MDAEHVITNQVPARCFEVKSSRVWGRERERGPSKNRTRIATHPLKGTTHARYRK